MQGNQPTTSPGLAWRDALAHWPDGSDHGSLQRVTAAPWIKVSDDCMQLEGLCFDRAGDLYFVDVFGGDVLKLDRATESVAVIRSLGEQHPAALKIHRDGRLFVCCLGDFRAGHVLAMNPDGSDVRRVLEGPVVDDMVFAANGDFYFTDFQGRVGAPTGGAYHWSADSGAITPILTALAGANGIALSRDERCLWITETNGNRLHRVALEADRVTIPPYGTSVPYYFTGALGPDSCVIDAGDNLYVAMYLQGRVLVFNANGVPIGEVVIPGREHGHLLHSTHPMIRPDSDELIICTNDGDGDHGSWLFRSRAFRPAHRGFQFA